MLFFVGMNTTAGSYALLGSVPPRDATVAANLREVGAIFLGKAGMSGMSLWFTRISFITLIFSKSV